MLEYDEKLRPNMETWVLLGQHEDEIANLCLDDVLDGRAYAAGQKIGNLRGIGCLHEERGITQDARGFLWFELLRDVPAQGTEACFRLNINYNQANQGACRDMLERSSRTGKRSDDCASRAPIANLNIHPNKTRSIIRSAGGALQVVAFQESIKARATEGREGD